MMETIRRLYEKWRLYQKTKKEEKTKSVRRAEDLATLLKLQEKKKQLNDLKSE